MFFCRSSLKLLTDSCGDSEVASNTLQDHKYQAQKTTMSLAHDWQTSSLSTASAVQRLLCVLCIRVVRLGQRLGLQLDFDIALKPEMAILQCVPECSRW